MEYSSPSVSEGTLQLDSDGVMDGSILDIFTTLGSGTYASDYGLFPGFDDLELTPAQIQKVAFSHASRAPSVAAEFSEGLRSQEFWSCSGSGSGSSSTTACEVDDVSRVTFVEGAYYQSPGNYPGVEPCQKNSVVKSDSDGGWGHPPKL
ncbi:hypothetical protein JRO89_XS03G0307400 [Xanthoceras sorbifolium]|uniref:Uncharacterized protein n=1 Tax=Xanthoceras sorbifolium TaxID=99658 RepID=A0ABQ8IE62_9ROSI|nr:hypothetical protein JRO89_XS03G0307400 [Xanthoceras sorbifolium]